MSDETYYARRRQLLDMLRDRGTPTSCAILAWQLDWTSHEVRAKLMSLRSAKLVSYDGDGRWWAV